jgi:hypothetical protein
MLDETEGVPYVNLRLKAKLDPRRWIRPMQSPGITARLPLGGARQPEKLNAA